MSINFQKGDLSECFIQCAVGKPSANLNNIMGTFAASQDGANVREAGSDFNLNNNPPSV